jgi:hypothetical protein
MPRGGKRQGAGRKPGSINRITALRNANQELREIKGQRAREAVTAAAVLGAIDEMGTWLKLVADPRTRLDAMKYLTDRRDGKAQQGIDLHADIGINIEARRARVAQLISQVTGS